MNQIQIFMSKLILDSPLRFSFKIVMISILVDVHLFIKPTFEEVKHVCKHSMEKQFSNEIFKWIHL